MGLPYGRSRIGHDQRSGPDLDLLRTLVPWKAVRIGAGRQGPMIEMPEERWRGELHVARRPALAATSTAPPPSHPDHDAQVPPATGKIRDDLRGITVPVAS
ncbi:MAG: hypothetical protein KIT69_17835 [Propionibacteriaceae bacterium]|nr:hypothetical protein [Propionibacteriaceae bacterium]